MSDHIGFKIVYEHSPSSDAIVNVFYAIKRSLERSWVDIPASKHEQYRLEIEKAISWVGNTPNILEIVERDAPWFNFPCLPDLGFTFDVWPHWRRGDGQFSAEITILETIMHMRLGEVEAGWIMNERVAENAGYHSDYLSSRPDSNDLRHDLWRVKHDALMATGPAWPHIRKVLEQTLMELYNLASARLVEVESRLIKAGFDLMRIPPEKLVVVEK